MLITEFIHFLQLRLNFQKKSSNRTSPTDPNPSEVTPLLEPLGDDPRVKFTYSVEQASGTRSIQSRLISASQRFLWWWTSYPSSCMGLARTGWQFTIFGVLGAFGLGFNPAMQSVTLALYTRRGGTEAGRLFGALSVIQAFAYVPVLFFGFDTILKYFIFFSSQILGPALYGFIYARTVATFPRTIFFVTVVAVVISFILLLLVRLPEGGGVPTRHPLGRHLRFREPRPCQSGFRCRHPHRHEGGTYW
jgi:hypothetical protein